MRNFLESLAGNTDFMAHGYCLTWEPGLLLLHVGADIVTGLSYYLIAAALFYLVIKRRDLPYGWMFHLFGAFIFACGTTHFMAAWTIYVPAYWAEGAVKTATAAISLATVTLLVPLLPRLLLLPSLSRTLEENRQLNLQLSTQVNNLQTEIARRQEAEEQVKGKNALLTSLMDAIPDLICYKDAQGVYLGCNKEFSAFSGYPKEEIIGRTDLDLFPREQAASLLEEDRQLLHAGVPQRHEEWMEYPDGRRVLLDTLKTPFRDQDNQLLGLIGISRDITERKRIEAEKENVSARFRTLVNSLDALVYVADIETHEVLFINDYGRKIWGDIVGKVCWQVLQSGQTAPCPFCTNARLLTPDGKPAGVYVWEFQNTVNGEWYECRDQAIEWTDGRYVRLEIATNITARKAVEQEKSKLEAHLRQAQKMEAIGTLAGGIAHDFNNILVPIIAYTDILMRDAEEGSTTSQTLAEIYNAASRAKELVKQILTFSREREHELNPVLITPVIKESIKLLKASLPSTITIRQDLEADHAMVLGDPTQLHQVIMNLCTNAYHAMREQGGVLGVSLTTVTIGVGDLNHDLLDPGPYLKLTVSDTGPGMNRTTMERIFEPYFTTKKREEGTGLGLAVVHGIVRNHKGDIKVYSEPGQGSSFHVYLPLLAGPQATATAQKAAAPLLGHEHILLVDDEVTVVEPTRRILEQHGYRVTSTTSSVEALELFRAKPADFDLVITDQTMPYMTGDHLALEVKRLRADIPIILCTGFSSIINETKAEALGIKAFLMKPVLRAELTETIRRVLDAR